MPLISGRNRDQERRAQSIMIGRIAIRYERAIAREIARAMNEASRKFYKPMALTEIRVKHADNMLKILTRLWTQAGKVSANANFSIAKSFLDMEFKRDISTPIVDAAISDWIRSYAGQKITLITKTTQDDITRIVANGVQDGLSEREIGKLIKEAAPVKSASRAQTIARTEAHGSSQGISLAVAGETEIPMIKVWLTNESDRTRDEHIDADGQTRPLNKNFDVGGESLEYPGAPSGSAENIINCFSGDTSVAFDSCKKSIRSTYSGEMITIETARGHKLTGTPNHPVLTDAGFVRLDKVDHTTNLVCCDLNDRITNDLDVNNIPTKFEEFHNSSSIVGMVMRVGAGAVNLYSRVPDSDVDIVNVDGSLSDAFMTGKLKGANKFNFKLTNLALASLFRFGLLYSASVMKLRGFISDRVVSGFHLVGPLLRCHPLPLNCFGFGQTPNSNIIFNQKSPNNTSVNSLLDGDGKLAHARSVVKYSLFDINGASRSPFNSGLPNELIDVGLADSEFIADVPNGLSRNVHVDRALLISKFNVSNFHVYTLETNEGFYNAGGIIAQNCRCVLGYEVA